MHEATKVSRPTIIKGMQELSSGLVDATRIRNHGGGRKAITEKYPDISVKLDELIEPVTRGDPESPLRWSSKKYNQAC